MAVQQYCQLTVSGFGSSGLARRLPAASQALWLDPMAGTFAKGVYLKEQMKHKTRAMHRISS